MNQFLITLFSDSNFLALNLLENLLSKNCFVNILTKDVKGWRDKTSPLLNTKRFKFINPKNIKDITSPYSIILCGYMHEEPYEELSEISKDFSLGNSKTLIIMPFEKFSFEKSANLKLPDNLGIVYTGDILGPRIDTDSDLLISGVIRQLYLKREMDVGVGEVFYPIFVTDAAKTISKWLFSFGPYGKETLLMGPQTSAPIFLKENQNLLGEIEYTSDEETLPRTIPRTLEIKTVENNLKFELSETYKWLSRVEVKEVSKAKRSKEAGRVKKKIIYPPYLKPTVFLATLILTLPIFLLLFSGGALAFSFKAFVAGDDSTAQNLTLISKTFSVIARGESVALSKIPILGIPYKELVFASSVVERVSNIGKYAVPAARALATIGDKILGNDVYDPQVPASIIKGSLDGIYVELSLLEAETENATDEKIFLSKFLSRKINVEKMKTLAQEGRILASEFPDLTGKNSSKAYLLLFQNNMELRPTGGFIGSFGILTFDGGRITDLSVNDVYSADGQLNGHVEPPAPIKNYLHEANWWFRDSNWDPDFSTSAKRAEWFLDKEMGRSVDGVIGVDLTPIKDVLTVTGPVFLPDFNLDITSENLYQKTQAEVQDNFFPGTHKKASFLTALSRSLLSEISKLGTKQKVGVFKSFYTDLEGRHIQFFLHDAPAQDAISKVGWQGAAALPNCGDGCYPDLIGEVEANVGVNKANYFIERSEQVSVELRPDRVVRTYTVTLKNNANQALGPSGNYGVYLRLLMAPDSQLLSLKSATGNTSENLAPEITDEKGRREVGSYVQVVAGTTKQIQFSWESFVSPGSHEKYGLLTRKQGGVGNDSFSLTINGKNVYNRILTSDYFARVDW